MNSMKKLLGFFIIAIMLSACNNQTPKQNNLSSADSLAFSEMSRHFTFIIANDLGRNGYFDQKPVAEMMGRVAGISGTDFIAALGDVHHFMGVQSVSDPLWLTDYELVYSRPELMIPWYPVLGNHEYRGNTKAVLDYSNISRRWQMPSRYYSKTFSVSDSSKVLLLFVDTTPMIDKYREDKSSGASKEDFNRQLKWIDSTLSHSDAKWKIVMGHHPVFAGTLKPEAEQADLQNRLKPILENYNVDFYICGHIHLFEHLKIPGSAVDYIVNTSASQDRSLVQREDAVFGSAETGFLLCTVADSGISISLVGKDGRILYSYTRKKA
jgi:hypothetical protein